MTIDIDVFLVGVAAGAVRSGMPVLLAALGEVVTERAGIINLGLEGIMLVGAWSGVAVTLHTNSPAAGVAAAVFAGAVLGLIHALFCQRFGANQVATGIAMMVFGMGLSAFLGIDYVGKKISAFSPTDIPLLSDIPYVGAVFFSHDPLVYAAYILVPVVAVGLYRTRIGLAIRAVGDNPDAAATAGIRVLAIRYAATAFGGALAGLGGAYLSLVYAQGWVENMTAGRGLVAVGLVIFASWNPWKAALGALLFGGATSFQLRLQATGIDVSQYFLGMLPYLLVMFVLVAATIRAGRKHAEIPAALGKPYANQA